MTYTLFLDDDRNPTDDNSIVVRSYSEACRYVVSHGAPRHVDFDHDLGFGPTGYDFAKWLVARAIEGGGFPESYDVHSQNPVGRRNIIALMNSYMAACNQ